MNNKRIMLAILTSVMLSISATAQNALINILTENTGIVKKGSVVYLKITINNTDPLMPIGIYKIKTQISVPGLILNVADTGHVLPTGWEIVSNTGTGIMLSNGGDLIEANSSRTIRIALTGIQTGGPSTISGQLSFSNGKAPGSAPGALSGDNPADNYSTSTCKVIR
ncbi:MAG: hypothetical protein NTW29_16145 [Bacteroidetes bacterium]|nr:hypothetical protein [Bacteroidota bacterium]